MSGAALPPLTLAEGEVTGHRHRITQGEAELYEYNETLYLKVLSPTALLTHEEHQHKSTGQSCPTTGDRNGCWKNQTQNFGAS